MLSKLRQVYYGTVKAQSADQPDGFPVAADMVRLKDRIADLKTQWEFLSSQPLLDSPETHGVMLSEVPKLPEIPVPDNIDVQYILNFIEMMYGEMAVCQSARFITGIQEHDKARGESYILSLEHLIDTYIEPRTPNDFADAAPEQDQVGAGYTGV